MFKKLVPSFILSFVISFMIWIYEPIAMYINNIEDLWFGLNTIIFPLLLIFIFTFIMLSGIFTLIYYLNNKYIKKIPIYKIILVISFVCFFASYIQGNFLAYNLPALDGTTINWNNYKTDNIISIILWIVIIIVTLILLKKCKFDKTINYFKYGSLIIFGMLFISFISLFLTHDLSKLNKKAVIFTEDHINDVSSDKNFFIFMVDSTDAVYFDDVLKSSEYKDTFKDFTFYKDTLSAYGFTRDSVPYIISGIWNENETDFTTYYNKAFDNSPLLDKLKENNYDINLYEMDNLWNTDKVDNINNVSKENIKVGKRMFYKQELKYNLYKYLPFFLKKYSRIEDMDFNRCKNFYSYKFFNWNNKYMYDLFNNEKINKIDNKVFSFIHLEGAHVPFEIDENFNLVSNGTFEKKILATIKLTDAFLKRLKENNLYDNSVIIIMADHGYSFENQQGRQNPILLIKGINEHHDMTYSDIPVSYEYLQDVYNDLLNDKKSNELFQNIDRSKPRRFLWYWLYGENHMVEYEQYGKAWDEDTLKPTGKEFNR